MIDSDIQISMCISIDILCVTEKGISIDLSKGNFSTPVIIITIQSACGIGR